MASVSLPSSKPPDQLEEGDGLTEIEGDGGGLDGGGLDGGGVEGAGADGGGAELSKGGGRATPDRPGAGSRMAIGKPGGGLLFAGTT